MNLNKNRSILKCMKKKVLYNYQWVNQKQTSFYGWPNEIQIMFINYDNKSNIPYDK